MIQLDGSTELQAIIDGVFKPPKREERRERQRYGRRGTKHHPVLTGNDPGADSKHADGFQSAPGVAAMDLALNNTQIALSEDLVAEEYAVGRIINPPPPTHADNAAVDSADDLYGLGYVPPKDRIWSGGQ